MINNQVGQRLPSNSEINIKESHRVTSGVCILCGESGAALKRVWVRVIHITKGNDILIKDLSNKFSLRMERNTSVKHVNSKFGNALRKLGMHCLC